uniref:Uncharacterized protein n=1 Tax=Oncorhynchus mykiss TaxID=8022 RepID=A0A8K9UGW8_ONCMY
MQNVMTILEENLMESAKDLRLRRRFQDNNLKHHAKSTMDLLNKKKMARFENGDLAMNNNQFEKV